MKIFILDNYDSFTYNIAQNLQKLGTKVLVKRGEQTSIKQIEKFHPQRIVISPGPMSPAKHPFIFSVIENFYQKIPILGICLGMQAINEYFGGKTKKSPFPLHGKTSSIFHQQTSIFSGIPSPFAAARYHSLIVDEIPFELQLTAFTEKNVPMAIEHKKYPIFGLQFHPESFLTSEGNKIFNNFVSLPFCHVY